MKLLVLFLSRKRTFPQQNWDPQVLLERRVHLKVKTRSGFLLVICSFMKHSCRCCKRTRRRFSPLGMPRYTLNWQSLRNRVGTRSMKMTLWDSSVGYVPGSVRVYFNFYELESYSVVFMKYVYQLAFVSYRQTQARQVMKSVFLYAHRTKFSSLLPIWSTVRQSRLRNCTAHRASEKLNLSESLSQVLTMQAFRNPLSILTSRL